MELRAKDVMATEVLCVKTTATVQELVELLISKKIGGVPVLDEKNRIAGVISKTDLITHGLEKELHAYLNDTDRSGKMDDLPDFDNLLGPDPNRMTVDQIMKTDVKTAKPDTKIHELVKMMLDNKIHRIVIADKGTVVGIVTTMDILRMIDTGE